jgi:putative hemolysin
MALMRYRRGDRFSGPLMIAVLVLIAAPGCGDDDDPSVTTSAGLANPASEFCVAQGGEVEIVSEAGGEVGYCNLPDGTRVEEWEYFRSQSANTTAP